MCRGLAFRGALVVTMLTLGAGPAFGQQGKGSEAEASSPGVAARADELFKAGMNDVRQQKWAEAEAKFLAAFELNRSYDIAANLGNTQYRMGKHRDAAEHLAFAVRSWPVIGKREQRDFAVKRLLELRKLVASVTVRVSTPGAKVLVDGKEVGRAPLEAEVFLSPGARVIEAKLEGYEPAKVAVEAIAGMTREVSISLVKSGANAGAGASGGVPPSASRPNGPGNGPMAEAPGGQQGAGGAAGVGSATPQSERSKGLIIAGIATSAAALGAGVVFAVVSNAKAGDAEEQRRGFLQRGVYDPCSKSPSAAECVEHTDTLAAQGTFGNLSIISFVVGGVLGTATAVYVLTGPPSKSASAVRVLPVASVQGGGVAIAGCW